jgi:hypothetical protein
VVGPAGDRGEPAPGDQARCRLARCDVGRRTVFGIALGSIVGPPPPRTSSPKAHRAGRGGIVTTIARTGITFVLCSVFKEQPGREGPTLGTCTRLARRTCRLTGACALLCPIDRSRLGRSANLVAGRSSVQIRRSRAPAGPLAGDPHRRPSIQDTARTPRCLAARPMGGSPRYQRPRGLPRPLGDEMRTFLTRAAPDRPPSGPRAAPESGPVRRRPPPGGGPSSPCAASGRRRAAGRRG